MPSDGHRTRTEAFEALARSQRGIPELMATSVRDNPALFNGTGLFTWMVEHMGDLTHRMTEDGGLRNFGHGAVQEKVERALRFLDEKERPFQARVETNLRNNHRYATEHKGYRREFDAFVSDWEMAANRYVAAHLDLTIWNEAHSVARGCAVASGQRDWGELHRLLLVLKARLDAGPVSWAAWAGACEFSRGFAVPMAETGALSDAAAHGPGTGQEGIESGDDDHGNRPSHR